MEVKIGFSKPKSKFAILSYLIRLVDRVPFSHCYVRWETSVGIDIIYEASKTNVKFRNAKYFLEEVDVVKEFSFSLTKDTYKQVLFTCLSYAGAPYSMRQLLGLGIYKLFGVKIKPLLNDSSAFVCSEIASVVVEDILSTSLQTELMTPKDLYNILSSGKDNIQ